MVKALHGAGLEVFLDVVYNHTAEGSNLGPTLTFRGLDNANYYRLVEDDKARYYDTTGTGNSLIMTSALRCSRSWTRSATGSRRCTSTAFVSTWWRRSLGTSTRPTGERVLRHRPPGSYPVEVKLIAEPWDSAI